MPTNLAYIEDTLEKAMDKEMASPTITKAIKDEANRKARKLIGGFRVVDKKTEEVEIDRVVKLKQAIVTQFRKNREQVIKELVDLGVKPIAVVPSGAWYVMSKQAGLYTLHPDVHGKVGVDIKWYNVFGDQKHFTRATHAQALKAMFPDNVSVDPSHQRVTPVLPNPPEDVAEKLLKVQKRKLSVTAVPDAISFAETREQIWAGRGTPKDIWAREQGYADYADWVKRDPIIFTEEGNAAAIIAQFGDFPIEKELVDKVVDADSIMALKPGAVNDMIMANSDLIRQQADQLNRQMFGGVGLLGGAPIYGGGQGMVQYGMQSLPITFAGSALQTVQWSNPIDSSSWTGR